MGLWSRWFSRSEPEDYEQILSSIALDIHKRQTRLSEIRLRERRTTLLVTLYAFAGWLAYVGLWYIALLPTYDHGGWMERGVKSAPVVLGPVLILFTRRIVQAWYTRIGNVEESTLKQLLAQQHAKIEEIKKKTNFYSTKNLIDRYDSSPSSGGPPPGLGPSAAGLRQRQPAGAGPPGQQSGQGQGQPVTPRRDGRGRPQMPVTPANGGPVPGELAFTPLNPLFASTSSPGPNPALFASPPPTHPPRKHWYDKLADALLGDDEVSATGGAAVFSRYALICRRCFAHNGLVKEEWWDDMQYVCPKCGHFNPSPRALRAEREAKALATSDSISATASPTSPALRLSTSPAREPEHARQSSSPPESPTRVRERGASGEEAREDSRKGREGAMEVDS